MDAFTYSITDYRYDENLKKIVAVAAGTFTNETEAIDYLENNDTLGTMTLEKYNCDHTMVYVYNPKYNQWEY